MPSIAIVGGSGLEGKGLGLRFALAGHPVILGSRDEERGRRAAQELREIAPKLPVTGALNANAASEADWALLSVPFEGLAAMARDLAPALEGKLVISVVAPLVFEKGQPHSLRVSEGSAAELVQSILTSSRVTSAFHNLSAKELLNPNKVLEGDIIVCGDDADARSQTMELAEAVRNLRAVDGGPLAYSRYVEDFTALLLHLNSTHKTRSTLRLLGI